MAYAGQHGKVMLDTTVVADVTSWTANVAAGTYDASAMGTGGWRKYATGLKEWSGSVSANSNLAVDGGQDEVQTTLYENTTVALKLYLDATHYLTGNALITSIDYETPSDGLVTFSFDFQGDGELEGPTVTTP
jgi:predicted secreted protein